MEIKKNDTLIIGLAVFAMFFGAGSLIFPPFLGLITGTDWFIGFMCFFIADVGLAFVTIIAMVNGDGSISGVTGVIGKIPSLIINTAVIVCIGPLLAIPRTGATTYEMSIAPIIPEFNIMIFSVIYFTLVLFLSIRPSKVVDIVGKILTPAMVVTLIILIVAGILSPLGPLGNSIVQSSVKEGILNGYQAMDVLGALGFALIIISTVNEKGYNNNKSRIRITTYSCIIAGALLFFVYCGLSYLGATVSKLYNISDVNQASLIVSITKDLLGQYGVVMLGVIVGLACLTTAIGLTSASAAYFENITNKKVKYEMAVVVICIFSMFVSNFGLSVIISIASPILSIVYPTVVTLIILSFFKKKIDNQNIYKGAAIFSFIISTISVAESYNLPLNFINLLPLSDVGLNWIIPAIVGGILGFLIKPKSSIESI